MTTYADDFHSGSKVYNVAGLDRLILRLGHLLDVLANAGLNINALKSAVLYHFKGTFVRTWLKTHRSQQRTVISFDSGLRVAPFTSFPVVSTHTYLGTRVSIRTPGPKRCNTVCSWLSWNARLRPLVCSKRGLFLQDRVRIWRSSVPATLLYGLASGLPVGGLVTIRA